MTGLLRASGKPAGFSLAEALIALAITATVATLAIGVLVNQAPKGEKAYGRAATDFITHLTTVCKKSHLEYGTGPLAAKTIDTANCPDSACNDVGCNIYAYPKSTANRNVGRTECSFVADDNAYRGIGWLLKDWESTVTYNSGDESLSYPEGIRLYLQPDMSNAASSPDVDPNGEIPDDTSGITTSGYDSEGINTVALPTNLNDIMYNTTPSPDVAADDRKFVLLDMNGTASPNSIGASGDRVLLYVEDKTCRVRTAYQACRDGTLNVDLDTCNQTYGQSFYDVFKCDEAINQQGLSQSSHCPAGGTFLSE